MNLIGITGAAGSGKDTAANIIALLFKDNYIIWHFADPLKKLCIDYLGLSYDDVYTREGKTKFNNFWQMTNREILQKVGTDCFRNNFSKDFYCKLCELEIKKSKNNMFIVPDIRFNNEAETIKRNNGIIIKMNRNNNDLTNIELSHESEQGILNNLIDYSIDNNGSLTDLSVKLNKILIKEKFI